ncbi:TPR repeat-containing thioredoxin TTL1-like isoform X1 [Lycium ferocissimum]|uniref:TPR repeat-containing thioredoxin TTL1-like isoform X1 n=1 Tax=Lycium ferocissimum TaxID=112874 RepID=UPI002814CDD5|nr:TPR repeat-containing thioredoxin TTL1-like isoform X1 [Lycium ferocissimum]
MSGHKKPDFDSLADRLRNSLSCNEEKTDNKPDFRELDLGSPVSPLLTRISGLSSTTTTTTSSSSSSSGSGSGRVLSCSGQRKSDSSHSGELSGSSGSISVRNVSYSGQRKSDSGHSGELSGSCGSISGRNVSYSGPRKSDSSHSGELSGSSGSVSGRNVSYSGHSGEISGPGHARPDSGTSSVTSPVVNALPTGNICRSGNVVKTGMASKPKRTDVVGSGTGNYGHGSIMRGGPGPRVASPNRPGPSIASPNRPGPGIASPKSSGPGPCGVSGGLMVGGGEAVKRGILRNDPEELKRIGNENYKKGNFVEALNLYDKAIAISPGNAALHCNRAAALIGLKRLGEAVRECEEAIRLDPSYVRAHQRLGSLLLSLGQVESARSHFFSLGHKPDQAELQKLQAVEKHISECTAARKLGDWTSTLKEAEAATAGAEASPQLFACRAEAYLKLHQLEDAELCLSKVGKYEPSAAASQSKIFGMLAEAYIFFVQAQIEMALGRFENALTAIERAAQVDPRSAEVSLLLKNVRLVGRARARGNDLFKSERYTEACAAYGEGLGLGSLNPVLYCNRAACWYKLEQWEKSLDDCNQALLIQPNYTKALLRRAASNAKLERWAEAVRDYEVLRRELPYDNEVAESLFHAQVALKKSRGEDVSNMKFGGEVELVSGLEQFRAAISSSGASVVHFKAASNLQCKQISPFLDTLCTKFPLISFLKVDVEESPAIATAENVRTVPTFKIYKNGSRVKEMVRPSPEVLESSVRHYSM